MDQMKFLLGAPVVLNVHAVWLPGEGWWVTLTRRLDFEEWSETRPETYERLSTAELGDVVCAVVDRLLNP